jgi:hypothetical protein
MTKVVLLTLEAVGAPIVEGGSDNIVAAFKQLIEAHGGTLLPGVDVARVIVERGRGTGLVRMSPKMGTSLVKRNLLRHCGLSPLRIRGSSPFSTHGNVLIYAPAEGPTPYASAIAPSQNHHALQL